MIEPPHTEKIAFVPQYMERPVPFERLAYKNSTGSYKAPDMLQLLLQFTATAVLGGEPWENLAIGELEDGLCAIYAERSQLPEGATNPVRFAVKSAWAPMIGNWITFDSDELMLGVKSLYHLLQTVEPETLVQRLANDYEQNDATEWDFSELGQTLWHLGVPREPITAANNQPLLGGWDEADGKGSVSAETNTNPSQPTNTISKQSRLCFLINSVISALVGGLVGGGLFGCLILIAEQFDSPYDDPSLLSILMGLPPIALLGAVIGAPFGVTCGLIFGLFAYERIESQKMPTVGLILGAVVGILIGTSLLGGLPDVHGDQLFWDFLLLACAASAGAVGGGLSGRLFRHLQSRSMSTS